jgi:hypothetical protein
VSAAKVSADGKTVTLEIDDLKPTWCMESNYTLKGTDGPIFEGVKHNTVHHVGE